MTPRLKEANLSTDDLAGGRRGKELRSEARAEQATGGGGRSAPDPDEVRLLLVGGGRSAPTRIFVYR